MRLLWIDILKLLAIFGVILLHVSAPFLVPFEISLEWWIGNIYDSLSRWCVPLFVMVSGALVVPGAEKLPLRQFLFIRMSKILIPFLVWSAIYFFCRIHFKGDDITFSGFFPMLLIEPIYYHLWFIYMLIVLYLFAPVVSAFLNEAPEKHAWYLIALWFFWASLLPILHKPMDIETYFNPGMDDYSALRFSGYFILGYMLKDRWVRSKGQLSIVLLVFVIAGAVTIIGTYVMSQNRGEFHPFFYKYSSVNVVAMSLSLFLLVKSIFHTRMEITEQGKERIRMNSPKLLQKIGVSVFGVYLIHALVLELLRDGHLGFTIDHTSAFGLAMPIAAGIPVFTVSIFVFSLLPVLFFRSIPILRGMMT
jgi:surface polysaccharide O-acyltransferase-like enzyme